MRLMYLRLMGYGGIYQGMNRNQIEIPFNLLRKPIILLQGDNGTGKSTIMNALSLEPDSSDAYRKDIYYNSPVPEQIDFPAEKEIHLMCGNDIYKILITSPVVNHKRKTTKAYISKNGEELNLTGNVTSYRSIRDTEFDVDPNYMALSMISSEDRGLVDKTPSQRKAFMSNILSSLDFYNNCYRNVSKKTTMYASQINNLKARIYNIGDRDNICASMISMKNRLGLLVEDKTNITKALADCEATIKILDPNGEIQNTYQSIVDELSSINLRISKYSEEYNTLYSHYSKSHQNDNIQAERAIVDHNIQKITINIENMKTTISDLVTQINKLSSSIQTAQTKVSSLQSELVQSSIEKVVLDLKNKIEMYQTMIDGITFSPDLSRSEAEIAKAVFSTLRQNIDTIRDNDATLLTDVLSINNINGFKLQANNRAKRIQEVKQQISILETDISNYKSQMSMETILSSRPKECTIDNCAFIRDALKYNFEGLQSSIEQSEDLLDNLLKEVDKEEKQNEYDSIILTIYDTFQRTIWSVIQQNIPILSKLGPMSSILLDLDKLKRAVSNNYQFNEFNDIDDCIGMIDIINECKQYEADMIQYEADLKIFRNNQSMLELLQSDINSKSEELDAVNTKSNELVKSIAFSTEIVEKSKKDLEMINQLIRVEKELATVKEEKQVLGLKFNSVKEDIKRVQEEVNKKKALEEKSKLNDKESIPLVENIEQAKFQLMKLDSYYEEIERYSSLYEKATVVKDACSPTKTGIQSLFIQFYFLKTIRIANDLLSHFFGGTLKLLNPIIDPNEFRMPFINELGVPVSDISKASTSQKCMFGMSIGFALLSQGSKKYNILRLDEIDGGLDTMNRMQFVPSLRFMMELMEVEQTIAISHNMEAESIDADIICLSKKGIFINGIKI